MFHISFNLLQCALPNQPCTKNLRTVQWPLALDGHRNGIKFRDIHYGQISSFCLLCFVFFYLLYFLERVHDTEHYFPMFLIPNILLCKKLYFVKIIVRFLFSLSKMKTYTAALCT